MRTLIKIFFLFFPALALANQTHEFRLDNGLRLIVREDHRAPVVVSQVWYKVGSSYEHGGLTGVSHVLEHMMFKGTSKYPLGVFDRIMSENGAQQNAATSSDFTFYYQELPVSKLRVSFELEADRMRHLTLDANEFAKEIKVIQEERRLRTEDNPFALTYERFNAAAFISSPYHHPVVGWMNDLHNMTAQDARQWYKMWYAPNNAIVVVVGDVNPQQVLAMAKQYFGPLTGSSLPQPKPQLEVKPLGQQFLTVKAHAKVPIMMMGYPVPSLLTAASKQDAYALEVISAILDGGASARLAKEEVRGSEIASTAHVQYNLYSRLSPMFLLYGMPTQQHTLKEVQTALLEQIERLKTEQVSQKELNRIKTQVIAQKIYARDSMINQAREIGELESVGLPWKTADEYISQIQSVTPKQIQKVAKRYFLSDHLTIAHLKPTESP